jgi:hypothetical protein
MRTALLLLLTVLGPGLCSAQTACDSLYKQIHPFDKDHFVTATWFEKAPEIIIGKEHLLTYNVPADRVGDAYCQVLIDERGSLLCLQWLNVTSAVVRAEAAKVVSYLRFSPGAQNGKPTKVPMTLVVRFRQGPPPTKKDLREAWRTRAR